MGRLHVSIKAAGANRGCAGRGRSIGQEGTCRPVEMLNNSCRLGVFSWPFGEFEWRLSRWLLAHDVLIPPGVNLPHSRQLRASSWRNTHISRFVPPHRSRRRTSKASSPPRFISPRFVVRSLLRPVPNCTASEKCGCPALVSVGVVFTASLDAVNKGALFVF